MAWTQAQLDALKSAAASGATEVTHDGKTVKYRNLAEIIRLIAMMEGEIAPTNRAPRSTLVRFDRGY